MNLIWRIGVFFAIFHVTSAGLASAAEINSWEELAAQWLNATYYQPGGRWVAKVIAAPPGWNLLAGKKGIKIIKIASGMEKPKKIMRLLAQNDEKNEGVLVIQSVYLRNVMTATRVLKRGDELVPGDWRWEEKDQDVLPRDTVYLEQELTGKRLKKFISPGEIISAHVLEPIPDMSRGKQITVRVLGNGVCVQADAETLEEGYLGKIIKVKLNGSGKIITASVAGSETADVKLVGRW